MFIAVISLEREIILLLGSYLSLPYNKVTFNVSLTAKTTRNLNNVINI